LRRSRYGAFFTGEISSFFVNCIPKLPTHDRAYLKQLSAKF